MSNVATGGNRKIGNRVTALPPNSGKNGNCAPHSTKVDLAASGHPGAVSTARSPDRHNRHNRKYGRDGNILLATPSKSGKIGNGSAPSATPINRISDFRQKRQNPHPRKPIAHTQKSVETATPTCPNAQKSAETAEMLDLLAASESTKVDFAANGHPDAVSTAGDPQSRDLPKIGRNGKIGNSLCLCSPRPAGRGVGGEELNRGKNGNIAHPPSPIVQRRHPQSCSLHGPSLAGKGEGLGSFAGNTVTRIIVYPLGAHAMLVASIKLR